MLLIYLFAFRIMYLNLMLLLIASSFFCREHFSYCDAILNPLFRTLHFDTVYETYLIKLLLLVFENLYRCFNDIYLHYYFIYTLLKQLMHAFYIKLHFSYFYTYVTNLILCHCFSNCNLEYVFCLFCYFEMILFIIVVSVLELVQSYTSCHLSQVCFSYAYFLISIYRNFKCALYHFFFSFCYISMHAQRYYYVITYDSSRSLIRYLVINSLFING